MIKHTKDIYSYNSINEFVKHINNTDRVSGRSKASETGSKSFTGTSSIDEAMKLLEYGDSDSGANLKASVGLERFEGRKDSVELSVVGYAPNVPNAILGLPNSMYRRVGIRKGPKVGSVFINIAVPAYVDEDDVRLMSAKIVSKIMALESRGMRFNVFVHDASKSSGNDKPNAFILRIKGDSEPMNLVRMGFALLNPSMLRRISFAWSERIPDHDLTHDGYGRALGKGDKSYNKELDKVFARINNSKDFVNIRLMDMHDMDYDEYIEEVFG